MRETRPTIGCRIEDLACNGIPPGETLTTEERQRIAEHAASFEECDQTADELLRTDDKELVRTAYWVMLDYVRGQL